MKVKTLLWSLLASSTLPLSAQIGGTWSGNLKVMNQSIRIAFHIDDQKKTCTMDSPDQGAKGIPTTLLHLSQDSLSLSVPMAGIYYHARMRNDKLEGIFSQNGYDFPLSLEHKEIKSLRPQTPQPPFPYLTKEVSFTNEQDHTTLCGTLTYPVGYNQKSKKILPVVLLVSGSGQQNRDEELFEHKPFAVIADYFARNGIATLRYDDRGIGKSSGDIASTTTLNNMRDAEAGLRFLRNLHEFGYVGLLGHSEGGMIAFMLAAQKKTDFIISLAGPGERGDKILLYQAEKMYPTNQETKEIIELTKKCYDYILSGKTLTTPQALLDEINKTEKKKLTLSPSGKSFFQIFFQQLKSPWIQYFLKYDPTNNFKQISCPTMAINGEKDMQVEASTNLGAIKKNLPKHSYNLIKVYPGLNHLFQHCKTGSPIEYSQITETISPEVLKDMVEWLHHLTIATPKNEKNK